MLMKILYGIQGTGNGHLTRSRVMAEKLANAGIEVTFLISGRAKKDLFATERFGEFIVRRGLTFKAAGGKIRYLDSLLTNNFFAFLYDVVMLDVSDYDLIISDYEPVTAWAAKLHKKPCIGIAHQYAFNGTPMASKCFRPSSTPLLCASVLRGTC